MSKFTEANVEYGLRCNVALNKMQKRLDESLKGCPSWGQKGVVEAANMMLANEYQVALH